MKSGKRGPRDLNKKTIPELKNTLWQVFAKWVKLIYSTDGKNCECFTCGKPLRIGDRDCQAGHFIPRTKSPTMFDERNVRPQCSRCNEFESGNFVEFERRLKDEIGGQEVENLKDLSREPWKWDRDYLITRIKRYREEVAEYEH